MSHEANEISPEDLTAAAHLFDRIARGSFQDFTRDVDRLCWRLIGCSYHDLPDLIPLIDYYEDGKRPSDAVVALAAELSDDLYLTEEPI